MHHLFGILHEMRSDEMYQQRKYACKTKFKLSMKGFEKRNNKSRNNTKTGNSNEMMKKMPQNMYNNDSRTEQELWTAQSK